MHQQDMGEGYLAQGPVEIMTILCLGAIFQNPNHLSQQHHDPRASAEGGKTGEEDGGTRRGKESL